MADPAGPEELERARRGYEALGRGDLEEVVADMAEDVQWRNPDDAVEGGTRTGREEFKLALLAVIESFEEVSYEIVDSAARGDGFALLVHARARGRTSGAPLDQMLGHVFRFEDGVQVAFEWYNDPADALRAIGASAWAGGGTTGS